VNEADCEVIEFGSGGGPGILPQEGEKLCQADKVTRIATVTPRSSPVLANAALADEGGECRLIGEEAAADGKMWFACDGDALPADEADCEVIEFGSGGGPGILPQEGEKLCQVDKVQLTPMDADSTGEPGSGVTAEAAIQLDQDEDAPPFGGVPVFEIALVAAAAYAFATGAQ